MKLGEMFSGNYWKAADLEKPVLLTIKGISEEVLGDQREQKWVVWFQEDQRGCVLNVTRAQDIAIACNSDDTDDWSGKKIVLQRGKTRMAGKTVDCVAVRAPKGQPQPEPDPVEANEFSDDEIPF